jgi:serine protease
MFRTKAPAALVFILALILGFTALGPEARVNASESDTTRIVDTGLAQPKRSQPSNSITVQVKPNTDASGLKATAAGLGGHLVRDHTRSGLEVFSFPNNDAANQALNALSRNPLVEALAPTLTETIFDTPNDTNYSYQWHLQDTAGGVRAEPAWDLAPNRGSGVVVAVIDTGVAYETYTRPATVGLPTLAFQQAPDLAGISITAPMNYYFDDTHANDDHSHGSHVTGTIAQTTNNAYGVAGIASNVTIMPIKVLDYNGEGIDADLVDAIYYAVDNGADVISMSLGFTGTGSPDPDGNYCTEIVGLPQALDYAYEHGVVVVAAAGNESSNVSCPAAYPTVIAVGASTYAAAVADYSNRGDTLDVVAPGGDPNADLNGDGFSDGVLQETYCDTGGWIILLGAFSGTAQFNSFCDVFMSGTSMATPHVTGIVALLLGQQPSLTPDQVRGLIEGTARDGGAPGWDPDFGYGIVDAAAALASLTGATPTPTATPSPTATPAPTATPPATDNVLINKASYNAHKDLLKVEATSSAGPTATLRLFDNSDPGNPREIGQLSYNTRRGVYSGTFTWLVKPSELLLVSSAGGQDTYSLP